MCTQTPNVKTITKIRACKVHCLIKKDFRQMPIEMSKLRVEEGLNAELRETGCTDTEWTVRPKVKSKVFPSTGLGGP
jgi:hypothetical protein